MLPGLFCEELLGKIGEFKSGKEKAKGKVIVVTFGNYVFIDFFLTWVKHLTNLGVSNLLVGAMDKKFLKAISGILMRCSSPSSILRVIHMALTRMPYQWSLVR
ncbi:hypothetical protein Droror1_Dr00018015 [Drosera rotundifolia]